MTDATQAIDKKSETPQQRAKRLIAEIEEATRGNYSKGEVKTILNTIAQMSAQPPRLSDDAVEGTCRAPGPATKVQRGDVFIAHGIGGKVRPWAVLRVRGDAVLATAISSGESAPGLIRANCRFWSGSWLGGAIAQFPLDTARRELMRPFTNRSQLEEVEENIVAAIRPKAPKSMAEIVSLRAETKGR